MTQIQEKPTQNERQEIEKNAPQRPHKVAIVGGGFGGLYTAKSLGNAPVEVTLVDKRNFHLFQPLLYQVATGNLSPADISSPLRLVLRHNKNAKVLLDEVVDVDPDRQKLVLNHKEIDYDTLIIATGVSHHYFGNDTWQDIAPGLKTIEDAIAIRHHIFMAFEAAEKETDPIKRQAYLTFVIAGGGPTGVELAGAIAEIAHSSLKHDFRNIDTASTRILLVEGLDRILPPYPPELSAKAEESLTNLGVTILTKTMVTDITDGSVTIKQGEQTSQIPTKNVLWAAGVKASAMGKTLAQKTGVELDRVGRVMVEPDMSIANYPNIFVIGDLANFSHQGDKPLPGVAPVAMDQGKYVAKLIEKRLQGNTIEAFSYVDKGSLAVIGQNAAVANIAGFKLSGIIAWFIWIFAHIYYLIEFDNKLIVTIQWGWNYITRGRGARLITGEGLSKKEEQNATESRDFVTSGNDRNK
jgi:NADH:ubiquinone reductase (H+-translocating)